MMKTLTVKPGLNGTDPQTVQIPMPKMKTEYVGLIFDYTVTDAGIAAGENIEGCVQHISVGSGVDTPIYVERDELTHLVDTSWEGISTGKMSDSQPTTATAHTAEFFIQGPFDFRDMESPMIEIALRDITDEFGGATVFTGSVTAVVSETTTEKPGVYFLRKKTIAATQHDIGFGTKSVKDALLIASAAVSKLEMEGRSATGESVNLIKEQDATPYERAWGIYKDKAAVSNVLFLPSLNSTYFADRALHVEMTSGTVLVFARCI